MKFTTTDPLLTSSYWIDLLTVAFNYSQDPQLPRDGGLIGPIKSKGYVWHDQGIDKVGNINSWGVNSVAIELTCLTLREKKAASVFMVGKT